MNNIKKILGTGGVGTGVIYRLEGDHDLGRNESRLGTLQDQKDFCKLHIILHYCSVILKELKRPISVFPIAATGKDDAGKFLISMMKKAGMKTRYLQKLDDVPTLFSVCYQFPKGDGGNITEKKSACDKVRPSDIKNLESEFRLKSGRSLVLAVPEVPLVSRIALLKLGKKHKALNAASFSVSEMSDVRKSEICRMIDLISLNMDEAAALGRKKKVDKTEDIIASCRKYLQSQNPDMKISITNGANGSFALQGKTRIHYPAMRSRVKNAAGAGDAYFSGLLLGEIFEFPFLDSKGPCGHHLAGLIAGTSTEGNDTIHFGIDLNLLKKMARSNVLKNTIRELYERNF